MKSSVKHETPGNQIVLRTLKKKTYKASPKNLGKYWLDHVTFDLQMGNKENVKRVVKELGI